MNIVLSKKENYILCNWKRYWLPSNISKPDMDGFMKPKAGYFNGELKTYNNDLSNKNYLHEGLLQFNVIDTKFINAPDRWSIGRIEFLFTF